MSGSFSIDDVGINVVEKCLVCASSDHSEILKAHDTLHGLPGLWCVRKCHACGHGFTSPRPDRDSISLYYPTDYSPFASPISHQEPPTWKSKLKGILGPLFNPREVIMPPGRQPGRVLEVGCGSGRFLVELARRGWAVQGIEPSSSTIHHLEATHGVPVVQGTVDSVEFPPLSFDMVVGLMVLEHLHDPLSDTRKIASWIRPGGWFMGSVPNCASWEFRVFGPNWFALQVPTHLSHFTPSSLRRLLSEAGFESPQILGQRNVSNLMIHFGRALGQRGWPLARVFLDYPVSGPRTLRLAAWPMATLLAAVGHAGRMTFLARKPSLPGN
jgi:2-polyprenyl-3-methyl-5-hydroxy-6-metoxy-1,4-benzoquinol methylase